MNTTYLEADTTIKRSIIGSIYPENLCFDGNTYRTARINEAARLIYLINSKLDDKKNRTKLDFSSLSDQVAGAGHYWYASSSTSILLTLYTQAVVYIMSMACLALNGFFTVSVATIAEAL